jgi:Uma2 family endonuclease
MPTTTADYLEAIEHLPEGATLRLAGISWDEYEELLSELGERAGLRVSYDEGRLQIVSPTHEHEEYKEFILRLAQVLAEETNVTLETRGSATYRRRQKAKGAEPDTSFYVQHAAHLIGKRRIDLETDPPPDVVVEIDLSNESLSKFPIYAALGVPEIWLYDGQQARFYQLAEQRYQEIAHSLAFPVLTSAALTDFLAQSKTSGQSAALAAFRQRAVGALN